VFIKVIRALRFRIQSYVLQFISHKGGINLNYCIEKNAGDSFNKEFLETQFNKKINKYTFGDKDHYLFCGSILSRANKCSIIIGAGLIEANKKIEDFKLVLGCRGELTLDKINAVRKVEPKFLGDPGLLVREEFLSLIERKKPSFKIGIVPHFVDLQRVSSFNLNDDIKIIDIKNDYKTVCKDILDCETIFSSSLHGLIFSDALKVNNLWVKFSDEIIGGNFKFNDYYSVMTNVKDAPIFCNSESNILEHKKEDMVSENMNYDQMKKVIFTEFSS